MGSFTPLRGVSFARAIAAMFDIALAILVKGMYGEARAQSGLTVSTHDTGWSGSLDPACSREGLGEMMYSVLL